MLAKPELNSFPKKPWALRDERFCYTHGLQQGKRSEAKSGLVNHCPANQGLELREGLLGKLLWHQGKVSKRKTEKQIELTLPSDRTSVWTNDLTPRPQA
jgi:hypothetical protein